MGLFSSKSVCFVEKAVRALHILSVLHTLEESKSLLDISQALSSGFKNCSVSGNYDVRSLGKSKLVYVRGKTPLVKPVLNDYVIRCINLSLDDKVYLTSDQFAVYQKLCGFIRDDQLYEYICDSTMEIVERDFTSTSGSASESIAREIKPYNQEPPPYDCKMQFSSFNPNVPTISSPLVNLIHQPPIEVIKTEVVGSPLPIQTSHSCPSQQQTIAIDPTTPCKCIFEQT